MIREIIIFILLAIILTVFMPSIYILNLRNSSLQKSAIDKGYASMELDLENYPPVKTFTWKK